MRITYRRFIGVKRVRKYSTPFLLLLLHPIFGTFSRIDKMLIQMKLSIKQSRSGKFYAENAHGLPQRQ